MHYCRKGIAQNNWTPLHDWSTEILNYFWNGLIAIYRWVQYVVRKLAEHNCMLKLFQSILNTSVYGIYFPILQDHLLLWQPPRNTSAFFGTQITQPKGNTKSSPTLNSCEISIRRLSWGCSIQIQFGNIFSAHNSMWIWKLWKSFVS